VYVVVVDGVTVWPAPVTADPFRLRLSPLDTVHARWLLIPDVMVVGDAVNEDMTGLLPETGGWVSGVEPELSTPLPPQALRERVMRIMDIQLKTFFTNRIV
jgi:hypothetical protein